MNLLDKHEGIGQGKLSKRRKLLKYGAPGEIISHIHVLTPSGQPEG